MDLVTTLSPIAIKLAAGYLEKTASPADDLAAEASSGHTHNLEALLDKDPSIDRLPALVAAAAAGQLKVLDILLNTPTTLRSHQHHHRHSNVSEDTQKQWLNSWYSNTTPLLAAVKNKHAKSTEFLLESGADPDLCLKKGGTALQMASRAGDIEIVRALLSYGSDVDWKDSAGDTALIIASRWGQEHVAHCLLHNGADVNARNVKGGTALLVAARHNCIEVVELLLRKGADVKARDRKGLGALHRAVEGKYLLEQVPAKAKAEVIKVLLRAGADPTVKDAQGKTPAQKVGWMSGGDTLKKLLDGKGRENRYMEREQAKDLKRRSTYDGREQAKQLKRTGTK